VLGAAAACAGLLAAGVPLLGGGGTRGAAYRALGLLTAALPCALVAVPLAYVSAIAAIAGRRARAGRAPVRGVLTAQEPVQMQQVAVLPTRYASDCRAWVTSFALLRQLATRRRQLGRTRLARAGDRASVPGPRASRGRPFSGHCLTACRAQAPLPEVRQGMRPVRACGRARRATRPAPGQRRGVLVRGGRVLDALADCSVVALDKTGTLTGGALVASGMAAPGAPAPRPPGGGGQGDGAPAAPGSPGSGRVGGQ